MKILHSVPTIEDDDIENVVQVLRSLHLEEGEYVRGFERAVSDFLNRPFSQATTNGFSAIHLSLIALGIKSGDEVIIPSYNCPALLNPVRLMGAIPVFVDIAKDSVNPCFNSVTEKITSRSRAAIIPHLFGFPAPIDEIKNTGLKIIEDCTQSLGGYYKGQKLGTFTDINITSFYATKMLTCGDAGMVTTSDKNLYDTVNNYTYYGHKKGNMLTSFNYHLTNLPASLGISQLRKIDNFLKRRKEISEIYDSYFSNSDKIFINFQNKSASTYFRYPILVPKRDILRKKLAEFGIGTGFGVLEGIHTLDYASRNLSLPNTQYYLDHILSIPIYPNLQDDEAHYIAEKTVKILTKV